MSVQNHLAPYELVGMPFYVWLADVASDGDVVAKPDLDAAPGSDWTLLGASGDENIVGDGVKVTCNQTFKEHKPPSSLTPTRTFRTAEQTMVDLMLADLRAEIWQLILGGNAITSTAAASGTQARKSVGIARGFGVPLYSLLIRGAGSPYYGLTEDYGTELWIPACYYSAESPEMTGRLDDGAIALPMQFKSVRAKVQTAVVASDILGRLELTTGALSLPATADQSDPSGTAIGTLTLPAATGGRATIDYTATGLPTGLAFDNATRQVTGTPTTPATYAVVYTATDADGHTAVDTFNWEIT